MRQAVCMGFAVSLFVLFLGNAAVEAQQANLAIKEMTIEVQPSIIVLPGGKEIPKVPLRATRVRSTELRNLNRQYNAISIERIFEVVDSAGPSRGQVESLVSEKKQSGLVGKRILRKTGRGYFEPERSFGETGARISKDKLLKVEKKMSGSGDSAKLVRGEQVVTEDDIAVVNDTFIIAFRDYKDREGSLITINLDEAVAAYAALPVVISAAKN